MLIRKTEIYRVRTVLLDASWRGVHVAAKGVYGCLPLTNYLVRMQVAGMDLSTTLYAVRI